jgi:hypothetical protein
MNQCFRWVRLMKKTRAQKSRATVPLSHPTLCSTLYFVWGLVTINVKLTYLV